MVNSVLVLNELSVGFDIADGSLFLKHSVHLTSRYYFVVAAIVLPPLFLLLFFLLYSSSSSFLIGHSFQESLLGSRTSLRF